MNLDPSQRLAEIESSVAQYRRLVANAASPAELGEQAGYIAALWRQMAEWYRQGK